VLKGASRVQIPPSPLRAGEADGFPREPSGNVVLTVRFDYLSLDPQANRLYISHMDARLLVFDVRTRRVSKTIAAPGACTACAAGRPQLLVLRPTR
jgi:hypothetical protein